MAFFRTLFGLEPGAREEFMDPHGRLRSLALRAPQGDLRIVLNVTEAPDLASHPLGVTQVAFRCDDVAASVKELRSRGVSFMPVPDNYYVDLAARFRLEPDRLNELREHQLMFDRVGEASCCTPTPTSWTPASTSSSSNAEVGTTATGAPTRSSGWRPRLADPELGCQPLGHPVYASAR